MALVLTTLSACSAVPDALNPAEWYNNTVDFFSGEDDQGKVADQKNPGEDQPFPTLASVPKAPANSANQGLVADVEGRKYADSIARQGEAPKTAMANAAPAPAAAVAPAQPAPAATPVISVTQTPVPAAPIAAPQQPMKAPAAVQSAPQPAPQVAALPTGQPANSMSPLEGDPYATVVVSSSGIEIDGSAVSLPEKPVLASVREQPEEAMPAPMPRRFQTPTSDGARIATILFDNGSHALDNNDRQILGEVVLLQKERGGMVRVVGHSSSRTRDMDPVRHAMINYKLSADRANKIATALIRQGMPAEVLMVDSLSDTMPLYSENMPSGEAGNRRAEVYFVN